MTVKLYDTNPYETKFTAQVISCEPAADRYAVVLDRTLFFPEEGGQTPDHGVLTYRNETIIVADVQIRSDEIIHYCDKPVDARSEVTGEIDWARRFDNMQQHTGEHIVSGLVHTLCGYNNVGFHLSEETVTMDYDGELSAEQIERIETLANQAIWEDHTVTVRYPEPAELAALDYRSKLDLTQGVRLVNIDGIDLCACCAPHVSGTAQVGLLKIIDYRRYKGGMRLWVKCGGRALADYRTLHEQALAVSGELSSPRESLADPLRALKEELESRKQAIGSLSASLLTARIREIPADQMNVVLFENDIDNDKALRDAANELAASRRGFCAVFFAPDDTSWRYICASTGSDCRTWNEELKKAFPVRGGGQAGMVRGSVTAGEDELRAWFEILSV